MYIKELNKEKLFLFEASVECIDTHGNMIML